VSDVARIDIEKEGEIIENHILFPNKTNVEFVQKIDDFNLRMRVWERGTGITQACGTGACATVVGAIRTKQINMEAGRPVRVILDGGELFIELRENNIYMTGPYAYSFKGVWSKDTF
ncbi:MAG: diaminopimelate epimerase, partial [Alphaproteobacteria bacterium]|nr:diaminopimelate epimerase [Alphaproteobacteria bacterium]